LKVRIGIDVGGTFTDGVAIDNSSLNIIGKVKVPTTHSAEEGVARGIIDVLNKLISKYNIDPDDIIFLAHGTTQATNALLEGDVEPVGILGTGSGLEGMKASKDIQIDDIELSPGKYIRIKHIYLDHKDLDQKVKSGLKELKNSGSKVIVAAEPYSVDDSRNEEKIMAEANNINLPATATHQISSLYGLKTRTRTAVINASILPKMIETANMTADSVAKANIDANLMIMRCDGGVMGIDEVKKRPILTMLSGPAAGVAGALMYEKISDGIFLESGGTSTDISVIKNGQVMIKFAEIGNHKTYVNSLDVHTVGIAGGSMIQMGQNKIEDVGPRSAHIAGLPYAVFADEDEIVEPELITIKPTANDPTYLAIKCANKKKFALTLAGAANILRKVPENSYSYGNYQAAYKAFKVLADKLNQSVEEVAETIIKKAVRKIETVVKRLIEEYKLDTNIIELVGGGGSAGVVTPYLGEFMNLKYRLAKNSEVISTIGVALAMVKEVVERNIVNPSEEDIVKIRKEVEKAILRSGAKEETIEIEVEIDKEKNIVRAIASGSTELVKKDLQNGDISREDLKKTVAESIDTEVNKVKEFASTDGLLAMGSQEVEKNFWGLIKKKKTPLRVITSQGVIKLKINDGEVVKSNYANLIADLKRELKQRTKYMDGGAEIPYVYIVCGNRILNLSGLIDEEQVISMAKVELQGYKEDEKTFIIFSERVS